MIWPLFVDRFGRSLRFCALKFDKEAISDGCSGLNVRKVRGFEFLVILES